LIFIEAKSWECYNTPQHTATHCNTPQHTALLCNTLQHTHCKITFENFVFTEAKSWEYLRVDGLGFLPVCAAACCSVIQRVLQWCVAVCYSGLQWVAVCCSVLQCVAMSCSVLQCAAVCCSVLQCVAVCCNELQCAAVCCNVLHCVLQCFAVPSG